MARLNCRSGVKIATPESLVSGLLTPLVAARTPLTGLRLMSPDATPMLSGSLRLPEKYQLPRETT